MFRPMIHAPMLSKPRAAKSSSTPDDPPSLPLHRVKCARLESPFVQRPGSRRQSGYQFPALVGRGYRAVLIDSQPWQQHTILKNDRTG